MKTYVVLLRGINVGGRNALPMKELAGVLEGLGCREVRTVLQSGNAVLEAAGRTASGLAGRLAREIEARRGFAPHAIVLPLPDFTKAMAANPFPEAVNDPRGLHLGFLDAAPRRPDLDRLESLRAGRERFRLAGRVFYLHAPDGVGRSKLAAGAERALGVPMTDRNWRTVCRIRDLAAGGRD